MPSTHAAKNPVVLSYVALRKVVGYVALALPFAVSIPIHISQHRLWCSISDYYFTGTRNILVGSLCAIATFMLCCRGYDWRDELASYLSAICAIGVAFCPTPPDCCIQRPPFSSPGYCAHYWFAAILFATLAIFCLFLFTKTSTPEAKTPRKKIRNGFYIGCGCAILASMALIEIADRLDWQPFFGHLHPTFVFESTSLFAFGLAWLIKGEGVFFLNDRHPVPTHTRTTDKLLGFGTLP